jgi:hypothetical protein
MARVAAGAFGFWIFSHTFDSPDLLRRVELADQISEDDCAVAGHDGQPFALVGMWRSVSKVMRDHRQSPQFPTQE